MSKIFSVRFNRLRKDRGLSQRVAGEIFGVSANAIFNWEHGMEPNLETIQEIADFFDVTPNHLLGYEKQPAPQLRPAERELLDDVADLTEGDIAYIRGMVFHYKTQKQSANRKIN
ncbi:MAG: helix-turn-helix domain-containing protein [Clostridiales bacterium]|jgi:transcriptional regulator with XRE-family HTH domain|nr:helix-turn-helix domain-containing protein [Clostridiales bacterium]